MTHSALAEVRSVDIMINPCVDPDTDQYWVTFDNIDASLSNLPVPTSDQYYLLAVNLSEESFSLNPPGWVLLGYDLAEGFTSSLLNCGVWEGGLKPIADQHNSFGLLPLSLAQLAKSLLPQEWGRAEPHAIVDVWACFTK